MVSNAGITSFRGFLFQVDVFIYYLAKLRKNEKLEYETLEDIVHVQNVDVEKLEYGKMILRSENTTAIQVKSNKTLSKDQRLKILYNWILIPDDVNVKEYILYMEHPVEESIADYLFSEDPAKLFGEIRKSTSKANALISQVKNSYPNEKEFIKKLVTIQACAKIINGDSIEVEIYEAYLEKLNRYGGEPCTYHKRLTRLKDIIYHEIREMIQQRSPYVCTHQELFTHIGQVTEKVTDEREIPNYYLFETNIKESKLAYLGSSRAYQQLLSCEVLTPTDIRTHMIEMIYYKEYKKGFLSQLKSSEIKNIELMGYKNYQLIKRDLQHKKEDTPFGRYIGTLGKEIQVLQDLQPHSSVYIYLTNDWADKNTQISWEDREDE